MTMPEDILEALNEDIEREAVHEHFVIDNIDKLDWAIRKIAQIEQTAQQKIECAERQILRLQEYIRRIKEDAERDVTNLQTMMEPFVKQLLAGTKKRSFNAPSGTVGFRKQEPEYEKNEEALIKWLEENDKRDFVRVKKQANWAEFKQQIVDVMEDGTCVTIDGELIPIEVIKAIPRPDKLYVKPTV